MSKKKHATFGQLINDSQPEEKDIKVGGHTIRIRELSGADRFELAERTEDKRWDLLVWVCMRGMVDPKPDKETYIEKMRPEWVVKIATSITDMSGLSEEAIEEAGKESENVTAIGGS